MRRYWIDKSQITNQIVQFNGDVFHHIFDVCRQELGSKFEVITEDSMAYLVEVKDLNKKSAVAQIIEERQIPSLKTPYIHLAMSIPRFPVFDSVLEKAVEMGVQSILPFYSDFSFMRKDGSLGANKIERWNKIIKSATQQSGRGDLLKLHAPIHFNELLQEINRNPSSWGLFAYEGVGVRSLKEELINQKQKNIQHLWIIVGSEGGFSNNEVQTLKNSKLDAVTLGNQVLRVETACISLVAAAKYEFDLMC